MSVRLWPVAAATAVAFVCAALVSDAFIPSRYRAETTLLVGGGRASPSVTRTVAGLVATRAVAENVARSLHLTASGDDLLRRLDVEARPGTAVVVIRFDDRGRDRAARIVQEFALVFTRVAAGRFGAGGRVAVWDPARTEAKRVAPRPLSDVVAGAGTGLVLGALLAAALARAGLGVAGEEESRRPAAPVAPTPGRVPEAAVADREPEPEPTPAVRWNLYDLEARVAAASSPDRRDEWDAYLTYLAAYAGRNGELPESFGPLVREVFAPLI